MKGRDTQKGNKDTNVSRTLQSSEHSPPNRVPTLQIEREVTYRLGDPLLTPVCRHLVLTWVLSRVSVQGDFQSDFNSVGIGRGSRFGTENTSGYSYSYVEKQHSVTQNGGNVYNKIKKFIVSLLIRTRVLQNSVGSNEEIFLLILFLMTRVTYPKNSVNYTRKVDLQTVIPKVLQRQKKDFEVQIH